MTCDRLHLLQGLPGDDFRVRILEGRGLSVFVDLEERLALDAVRGEAELPHFEDVGSLEESKAMVTFTGLGPVEWAWRREGRGAVLSEGNVWYLGGVISIDEISWKLGFV
jgi:hypothetical protein